MQKIIIAALLVCAQLFSAALAEEFSYEAIAKRFNSTQLDATSVEAAKMQGECLVGLKRLNFRKRPAFDPVADWPPSRSLTMLEQFPPCSVLIMMEVARKQVVEESQAP